MRIASFGILEPIARCLAGTALSLLCLSGCNFYFGTSSWALGPSHATKADDLRKDGKCAEAIDEYLLHVTDRLNAKNRAQDENPYFYSLLIGDCRLQMGDPDQAKQAYVTARDKSVTPALVNERLRRLGGWYEKQDRLQDALDILKEFRTLDPLMFDYDIDRINKEVVRREEAAEAEAKGRR